MTDDRGPPRPPIEALPPDWTTLAPLLDRVLDAEPDRREAVLDELSAGDPARRAALARLVEQCDQGTPLFDRSAAERFSALAAEDNAPRLPAILGGHYETSRELGRGGMAWVYLARDTKHGRDVAVKVIRTELAASMGRDRFLREIAIAARLRHPNIVPLYDSGDADGLLYFVMPYEDGPSLRSRLAREGPLPIPDALHVLRDVTRALQYAHEHGVVHRDIKPDNVMMSGGAAVVTDFGIAKAVSAAQAPGTTTDLTLTGGDFSTCSAPRKLSANPKPSSSVVRQLWGHAHGNFRTTGHYSSATIRGTIWGVQDRCDGTLTTAIDDVVTVVDTVLGKTVSLNPGQTYLAKPKPFTPPTQTHKPTTHKASNTAASVRASGLVWAGHRFKSKQAFSAYLSKHGSSWTAWAKTHPLLAAALATR